MMALLVRLVLSLTFGIAGLAKLADLPGSRQAARNFGVPERLSYPLGTLLPLAEIATAIALLFSETAWAASVSAFALLGLFIIGISVNLARGRTPDCHCFGQLHSAPAGRTTLIRNGVLAAGAAFIVWQGHENVGSSVFAWLATLSAVEAIVLIMVVVVFGLLALEGWFLLHLMRQNGRLLLRIEALETHLEIENHAPMPDQLATGLHIGEPAPTFSLFGLYGETTTLDTLRASGKPVMLIFADPGCGPCAALLPDVAHWQKDHAATLTIALISQGAVEANRLKTSEYGLVNCLLQKDREIAQAYQVTGTPSAVVVNPNGKIDSHLAMGAEAIALLVKRTLGGPLSDKIVPVPARLATNGQNGNARVNITNPPTTLTIGEPAPEIKLPDLDGKIVELANFRGSETVVLFWNPGCGFCNRMLEDVRAWEANPPENAPKLLFVSTGTVEANTAMEIHSPIMLEPVFAAGRKFGVNGTPSAIRIDANGNIGSEVAVGAPPVLALIGASKLHNGVVTN